MVAIRKTSMGRAKTIKASARGTLRDKNENKSKKMVVPAKKNKLNRDVAFLAVCSEREMSLARISSRKSSGIPLIVERMTSQSKSNAL